MAMREYMAALDDSQPDAALALMDERLQFLLALPAGTVRGTSKADYVAYLAGRQAPPDRRHVIQRFAVDGDVELAYGVVTEGGRIAGAFQSCARVTPQGLMLRYLSLFDPVFALVDPSDDGPAASVPGSTMSGSTMSGSTMSGSTVSGTRFR